MMLPFIKKIKNRDNYLYKMKHIKDKLENKVVSYQSLQTELIELHLMTIVSAKHVPVTDG